MAEERGEKGEVNGEEMGEKREGWEELKEGSEEEVEGVIESIRRIWLVAIGLFESLPSRYEFPCSASTYG